MRYVEFAVRLTNLIATDQQLRRDIADGLELAHIKRRALVTFVVFGAVCHILRLVETRRIGTVRVNEGHARQLKMRTVVSEAGRRVDLLLEADETTEAVLLTVQSCAELRTFFNFFMTFVFRCLLVLFLINRRLVDLRVALIRIWIGQSDVS